MDQSQRAYTRVAESLRVRIEDRTCRTEDLSLGGFRLRETPDGLDVGCVVDCVIDLPTADGASMPIRAGVEICRANARSGELGARIESISREDFLALARHIDTAISRALQSAEAGKAAFLQTLNHQVNTPLNAILGFSEIGAMQSADARDLNAYFRAIREAGDRLMGFLNTAIEVSALDAATLARESRPTLASDIIAPVIERLGSEAAAQGIRVVNAADETDAVIQAAPERAVQALWELARNALAVTPKGGEIRIGAERREGGRLAITVHDAGPGIPAARLGVLFQPFAKGCDDPYTSTDSGPGLGLTVAARLARLMGGDISVSSIEGLGSRFTLLLPLALAVDARQRIPA